MILFDLINTWDFYPPYLTENRGFFIGNISNKFFLNLKLVARINDEILRPARQNESWKTARIITYIQLPPPDGKLSVKMFTNSELTHLFADMDPAPTSIPAKRFLDGNELKIFRRYNGFVKFLSKKNNKFELKPIQSNLKSFDHTLCRGENFPSDTPTLIRAAFMCIQCKEMISTGSNEDCEARGFLEHLAFLRNFDNYRKPCSQSAYHSLILRNLKIHDHTLATNLSKCTSTIAKTVANRIVRTDEYKKESAHLRYDIEKYGRLMIGSDQIEIDWKPLKISPHIRIKGRTGCDSPIPPKGDSTGVNGPIPITTGSTGDNGPSRRDSAGGKKTNLKTPLKNFPILKSRTSTPIKSELTPGDQKGKNFQQNDFLASKLVPQKTPSKTAKGDEAKPKPITPKSEAVEVISSDSDISVNLPKMCFSAQNSKTDKTHRVNPKKRRSRSASPIIERSKGTRARCRGSDRTKLRRVSIFDSIPSLESLPPVSSPVKNEHQSLKYLLLSDALGEKHLVNTADDLINLAWEFRMLLTEAGKAIQGKTKSTIEKKKVEAILNLYHPGV